MLSPACSPALLLVSRFARCSRIGVLVTLALCCGCVPAGQTAQPLPLANSQVQPRDDWEVMYIGEAKIGFSHTTVTTAGEGAAQTVKTTSDNEMTFNRFGQTVTMTIQIASEEKPDGTPLSFSAIQQVGPSESVSTGTWTANSVTIEARTLDKKESKTIAWRPELGGVFAKDQSLQRKPLQPGEQRTLTALFPVMNKLGEIRFKAQDYETTKLLSGEASLLKVDCTEILGTERIGSTLWVDKNGEVQKQYLPQLKQTSYRTTREIATGKSNGPKFDLGDTTIVKIKKGIARPHQTQQIIYKATLPAGEIAEAFVSGPSQSLKLLDKHTAELTVRAIRPHEPKELAEKDSPPTDDDREPNNLVQCDDKLVVEMANSVVPGEKDPWKVAVALERYVRGIIKTKNFSQAFASAAEVAKNKEGDCTEHAVLLAALCRARGIPARGAMGLVYYAPSGGFAYHMWTEVWIDDRWIPLDATLAQGGIGAAHLKIAQSNLKGADALSAFLPVFRVLGQLELEVIATKP